MTEAHDTTAAGIDRQVRTYLLVFVGLMLLTVATVGVYYVHMTVAIGIVVALFIASIKASLVACFFMHLLDEKKLILWLLALTAVFFVVLLLTGWMTRPAHDALRFAPATP